MKKLSITELKKELEQKTKKDLISEISNLAKRFPEVKMYFQSQYSDSTPVFEKYKGIIEKEFVFGKTAGDPKARLNIGKKAIQDFKKIEGNPRLVADLMLTFVECVSNFNSEYGVDEGKYYTSPEAVFLKALELLDKNNLLKEYQKRVYDLVDGAGEQWGHYDTLHEIYMEFYEESLP